MTADAKLQSIPEEARARQRVGLTEYANITYVTPEAVFTLSPGGKLSVKIGETEHKGVTLHRAFPFGMEDRYISVKDKEGKELGIIDKLNEFAPEVQTLLREQMALRYFAPVIRTITSVKEDFGYLLWSVETDMGAMMFTTQSSSGAIIPVATNRYLVVDLDGNRFEIPDVSKLSPKDFYKIEMYI